MQNGIVRTSGNPTPFILSPKRHHQNVNWTPKYIKLLVSNSKYQASSKIV